MGPGVAKDLEGEGDQLAVLGLDIDDIAASEMGRAQGGPFQTLGIAEHRS